MKKLTQIGLWSLLFGVVTLNANAICPMCTIAVGAGLTFLEVWGVDLLLAGIWAGGLTLSLVFWTASYMNRRGIKSGYWYLLDFILYYAFLGAVYLLPEFKFGAKTLWGIDKLLLGIIVGTVLFYIGAKLHARIKAKNGGKSKFPFQKVIIPISFLVIATIVFSGILYL